MIQTARTNIDGAVSLSTAHGDLTLSKAELRALSIQGIEPGTDRFREYVDFTARQEHNARLARSCRR